MVWYMCTNEWMGPTVSNFKADEVARCSETLAFIYQIKRGHVQGNQIVAAHRCENKYEYINKEFCVLHVQSSATIIHLLVH